MRALGADGLGDRHTVDELGVRVAIVGRESPGLLPFQDLFAVGTEILAALGEQRPVPVALADFWPHQMGAFKRLCLAATDGIRIALSRRLIR